MKNKQWDVVVLSLLNSIMIIVLIFAPVYLSIHQNNYYWLWMWCWAFFVKLNSTKK